MGLVGTLLLAAIPVIVAITLHEAAHGYAAWALGDDTAKQEGRLSLNPLRHVDRFGTLILPGLLMLGQILTIGRVVFMFGWAKPVPVSAWRFKHPRQGMALVAAAGPAMNFLLAWLAALALTRDGGAVTDDIGGDDRRCPDAVHVRQPGARPVQPAADPAAGRGSNRGRHPAGAAGDGQWARLERAGIVIVLLAVFLLPHALASMGIVWDPVGNLLGNVLPWATHLVFARRRGGMPDDPVLELHLDGFEGPMDLLLDLARAQKVDLHRISILALVEQYLAIVESARVRLDLAADWLVMAAWLTWLKSRLLLPAGTAAAEEGEEAASVLAERLESLERVRKLASWLNGRAQLGVDAFARGVPEILIAIDRSGLSADISGLIRAYAGARRRATAATPYQPRRGPLFSMQDALERLQRMLGQTRYWTALDLFLPILPAGPVERRAAVASTLLAGLELARTGLADLRQEASFGPIMVRAAG